MQSFLPTVRLNLPEIKGMCMDFSDHRNFWAKDLPAVMITDTSFFRNPNYHSPETCRKRWTTAAWPRWSGACTRPSCIWRRTANKRRDKKLAGPDGLRPPARP